MQTDNFNPVNAHNCLVKGEIAVCGLSSVFSDKRPEPACHADRVVLSGALRTETTPHRRTGHAAHRTSGKASDFPDCHDRPSYHVLVD
jgi:hypothetical protein